ncbi:hypothetical protein B0H14DRAFT_860093 [Mycena olivaceomarginata]|nr:hypothetical protein B0H14DRAFT_860093 [Mycena olivaceomarginata]
MSSPISASDNWTPSMPHNDLFTLSSVRAAQETFSIMRGRSLVIQRRGAALRSSPLDRFPTPSGSAISRPPRARRVERCRTLCSRSDPALNPPPSSEVQNASRHRRTSRHHRVERVTPRPVPGPHERSYAQAARAGRIYPDQNQEMRRPCPPPHHLHFISTSPRCANEHPGGAFVQLTPAVHVIGCPAGGSGAGAVSARAVACGYGWRAEFSVPWGGTGNHGGDEGGAEEDRVCSRGRGDDSL